MRTTMMMIASAVCLLGCASPQEKAMQQQAEMDRMMAQYGPACAQLGHAPNTDPWRNCVLQLATRDGNYRGGVSTSIFGSFGSWGRGSGVGIGIGVGR